MKKYPDELTALLVEWKGSGRGWDELFRKASEAVIRITGKRSDWDEDRCSDFYLFFFPRLVKLLQNFEYKGLSFYAILNHTISWQVKSYFRRNRRSQKMEQCLKYNSIIEAEYAYDSDKGQVPDIAKRLRCLLQVGPEGRIMNRVISKRLLILALKNANHISDEQISRIAELTGKSPGWIESRVDRLRLLSESRRRRRECYCDRTSKAYMEICQLHREIGQCENSLERCLLQARLERLKKRFCAARASLNSVAMTPTNREVAEVLNLPKGSVDSGLYHLRKLLEEYQPPDDVSG